MYIHHQHSTVPELLIQAFFKPGSSINPDHRDKYIFILAYSVSVYEHPLSGPCLEDLEPTRKAIETAHLICSRANASHAELQVSLSTVFVYTTKLMFGIHEENISFLYMF